MKKASLIVAESEKSADMLYATGFRAPDPFIYFSLGSKKGMILSVLEYDRGCSECRSDVKAFRYEDFIRHGRRGMGDVLRVLAKSLNVGGFRVPPDFPLGLADYLRKYDLEVSCSKKEFFPEREFKSAAEIELLREAQRVTGLGMKRAENILRESVIAKDKSLSWNGAPLTSEILRAEINIELIRNNAFATSTIAAGGKQSAEPHNEGCGVLMAHTPVILDIFPRVSPGGYHGDMTRTFVKGKAPDMVKKAYQAVLSTRERCKTMVRAGAIPAEIHAFATEFFKQQGFPTGQREDGKSYGFFHGLGHGLGLEVHEAPRMNLRNAEPFKGGEVVTVEPGVYDPDWGGIRLEDVVAVGPDGADCLTDYPDQLELD